MFVNDVGQKIDYVGRLWSKEWGVGSKGSAGALVSWLWEETQDSKVVGLIPGAGLFSSLIWCKIHLTFEKWPILSIFYESKSRP